MKKLLIKIFGSFVLYISFCIGPAFAGFGISPALIYHDHLKPGMHYEQEVFISRSDPDETLTVLVEPDLKDVEGWFKFEPGKKFTFPKGKNMMSFKAIIDVPKDAEIKKYHGFIRVKATNSDSDQGGVSVVKGARMDVDLIATEINVVELNIQQLKLEEAKQDKDGNSIVTLHVKAENTGNTPIAAEKITLDLLSIQQKPITVLTSEDKLPQITPSETKTFDVKFKTKTSPGEYFAVVKVYFNGKVIKTERLILKIIGDIPVVDTSSNLKEQSNQSVFIKIKNQMNSSKTTGLIALSLALVTTICATFIVLKKQRKNKKIFIILALISIGLAAIGLSSIFKPVLINKNTPQSQDDPKKTGTVQGETTEKPNTNQVKIDSLPEEIKYYIYQKPDLNSSVIHVATEGEKFDVLDENSQWYRIQISDKVDGWIQKNNIRKVE